MKPNRDVIRTIVTGVRAIAIITAGLFCLTALVLWQQTLLPNYSDGFGVRRTTGSGFRTPFGGACAIETTTLYATLYSMRAEQVADRAFTVQCTESLGEESRLRLIVSHGFLDIAYCWFIPFGARVTHVRRDFHILSFDSGYAPDALRPGSRRPFGRTTSLRPPPVLVGKGVSVHLLLVAFLFGVCAAVPLFRGPVRRWYRARRGRCIGCGYDLTGNVSGVCPECGRLLDP